MILTRLLQVQIVLLDTYSYLDNVDYPVEQVLHRMEFYRHSMIAALQCLGIDSSNIEFVQESSYETPKFTKDLWRLCTMVPAQAVKDSWDRAVHPEMVSPLMCPLLQLLAEEYLDADFQFGGEDQVGLISSPLEPMVILTCHLSGLDFRSDRAICSKNGTPPTRTHDEPHAAQSDWQEDVGHAC